MDFLDPDVQGGFVTVPGIAAVAAVSSDNVHYGLAGIELAEDVGVDAGAIVGFGKDGFFRYHSAAVLG